MTEFFEAIQSLFVDGLFLPFDALRALELESWTMANVINWLFMAKKAQNLFIKTLMAYFAPAFCKLTKAYQLCLTLQQE